MQPLEPADLFPHLASLLDPPVQPRSVRGRPAFCGTFRGHPASIRIGVVAASDERDDAIELVLEGRTWGVECLVVPLFKWSAPPLGDAEFDAHYHVAGAPRAVLTELFGPDLRARLTLHPASFKLAGDRLELLSGSAPMTADSVAAHLEIAATILDQLPDAIRAAGVGAYLEQGSLATHPEVAAQIRRRTKRRRLLLVVLVLLVAGATALGIQCVCRLAQGL